MKISVKRTQKGVYALTIDDAVHTLTLNDLKHLLMASVKALTRSTFYRIEAKEFRDNHFNIPQWFLTILKQLVNRICSAGERFDEVCKIDG